MGDTFHYRKPYGKAGPGPYEKGRSLTGRAGVPYGTFTEKDDEEAYGKAAPYGRNGPYGARTGRHPYGKAPYGEASYGKAGPLQEAPYEERRCLREGRRGLWEGRALTGSPLRGGTVLTRRAGPLWKGRGPLRVLHREERRRGLREGRALTGNPLALTGRPTYEKASYGEASYRKAPYGEASYEKAPYELQESLREAGYQNWAGISACVP